MLAIEGATNDGAHRHVEWAYYDEQVGPETRVQEDPEDATNPARQR